MGHIRVSEERYLWLIKAGNPSKRAGTRYSQLLSSIIYLVRMLLLGAASLIE